VAGARWRSHHARCAASPMDPSTGPLSDVEGLPRCAGASPPSPLEGGRGWASWLAGSAVGRGATIGGKDGEGARGSYGEITGSTQDPWPLRGNRPRGPRPHEANRQEVFNDASNPGECWRGERRRGRRGSGGVVAAALSGNYAWVMG
jgi:hypothetical protein